MLLSVTQAAQRRKITRRAVLHWIANGLRARRIGNQWVIDTVDLDAWQTRPVGNPNFGTAKAQRRSVS